jgi:MoxR-like ATPase
MGDALEPQIEAAAADIARLKSSIARVIVGQEQVVDEVVFCLLAGGHVLLEGAPGLGKTLLVRTLAVCTDLVFSRIQFTPDLLPSDVLGTQVLASATGDRGGPSPFTLHKGPIFGQLILADEINRATPKTQSALLEAMAEQAVTLGGARHALEPPFCVLATQNPIEMEGTYPLPEAQLDRFLLKTLVPSPTEDDLVSVLLRTTGGAPVHAERVLSRSELLRLCALCRQVSVAELVLRYAARIVGATDPSSPDAPDLVKRAVRYGAGVRGAQALVLAAKAASLCAGRSYVAFDDIVRVARPALRHRVIRSFEGEADGVSTDAIVDAVVASVPARPPHVEAEARRGLGAASA